MNSISKSWQKGFAAARAASHHSNSSRISRRMGAALFSKSILISIGFNVYGHTHPNSADKKTSIHAEHKAVLKRQYYNNSGLVLYTYRETADGLPACSKPCLTCQQIIREAGISKVRFVDSQGGYAEMFI